MHITQTFKKIDVDQPCVSSCELIAKETPQFETIWWCESGCWDTHSLKSLKSSPSLSDITWIKGASPSTDRIYHRAHGRSEFHHKSKICRRSETTLHCTTACRWAFCWGASNLHVLRTVGTGNPTNVSGKEQSKKPNLFQGFSILAFLSHRSEKPHLQELHLRKLNPVTASAIWVEKLTLYVVAWYQNNRLTTWKCVRVFHLNQPWLEQPALTRTALRSHHCKQYQWQYWCNQTKTV